jgi:hypothetical protein
MAKKENMLQKVGSWAFIIGVIIAIAAGFWDLNPIVTAILVILGLLVGLLNVTSGETQSFIMSTAVLVIVATFGGNVLATITPVLHSMMNAIIVFVVPATIIVCLRAIYQLASD